MNSKICWALWVYAILWICPLLSFGDSRLLLIHTSDIHSHYTPRDSEYGLGGVARLKWKIDKIREQNSNNLLLDSGDWTEGSLFYALGSGVSSHRVMESIGFDAIVLGNHEWLVGPKELYKSLVEAQLQVPILGANINFNEIDSKIQLSKYIFPNKIFIRDGKKIGVFGLSTFNIVYNKFFSPVEMTNPIDLAKVQVDILKAQGCDVVIALTHTGLDVDKKLAEKVSGIDLILGGHTHILLREPIVVNGVPIVHVGKWGEFLGEYEITISKNKKVILSKHKIHQIDSSIPEDPAMKLLVEDSIAQLKKMYGEDLLDETVYTQVDLKPSYFPLDNPLANWTTDAFRENTNAELAMDHSIFFSRNLYEGWISKFDVFNLHPQIYNPQSEKTWTLKTFEIPGYILVAVAKAVVKLNKGFYLSNGTYVLDRRKRFFELSNLRVSGDKVKMRKWYKVASTDGLLHALEIIGLKESTVRNIQDTGKEVWTVIYNKLKSLNPISIEKIHWEGRIRFRQPDIHLPSESLVVEKSEKSLNLKWSLINAGLRPASVPKMSVYLDSTPKDKVNREWVKVVDVEVPAEEYISPGEILNLESEIVLNRRQDWISGGTLLIEAKTTSKDAELRNNRIFREL